MICGAQLVHSSWTLGWESFVCLTRGVYVLLMFSGIFMTRVKLTILFSMDSGLSEASLSHLVFVNQQQIHGDY